VRRLPVALPSYDEQTEIVLCADQLKAKVASTKNRIDQLGQSILAKDFRDELLPQDPE
jgi:type I restriction enzyme S subunit